MRRSPTVYRDQSARGLRLTVIGGPLDLRPFHALDWADSQAGELGVRARILGASHLVEIRSGGCRLHEVFACATVPRGALALYSSPLDAVGAGLELELREGGLYRFRSHVSDHAEARLELEALAHRAEIAAESGGIGLDYEFPRARHGDLPPRTIVCADLASSGDRVVVASAHSYPNEGSVVFSETCIDLPGRGS